MAEISAFWSFFLATLQLDNIHHAFGDLDILQGISLSLDSSSRAALAGMNGSGKSTLMKIISGDIHPDSGMVHTPRDFRISYLPQSGLVATNSTLYAAADEAFAHIHTLNDTLKSIENRLQQHTSTSSELQQLLEEHHAISESLLKSGYYDRESEIFQVLTGLGFSLDDIQRPCGEFSGGWQTRIARARALLSHADFLLLDEPTNYLDVEARIWLRSYIATFSGGICIVSHDRDFLDRTVNEVLEIFQGTVSRYAGNYSAYEQLREERNRQLVKQYSHQQEEIARIEQFIERFRYKDSKAKQVQSRIIMLEKMERIELPKNLKKIHFSFPPALHSGKQVLRLEHLSRSYGELTVIKDLSLGVTRGDRLAVTGKNGAGKSTLLRILAQQDVDYRGKAEFGTGLSIGYFAQDSEESLNSSLTVYEEIEQSAPTALIPKLRTYLGAFLFHGDDIYKQVSVLSGGEKSRLSLLKLLLAPHNLLILDEPTNHLDIPAKDVLLEALNSFTGTLIFVSHDSYFIRKLATRILFIHETETELFEGDYEYFSWKLEQRNRSPEDAPRPSSGAAGSGSSAAVTDWKQRNTLRNQLRRCERTEEQLMERIEHTEAELSALEADLADPLNYQDGRKMQALDSSIAETRERLETLYRQWEENHRLMEETGARL